MYDTFYLATVIIDREVTTDKMLILIVTFDLAQSM